MQNVREKDLMMQSMENFKKEVNERHLKEVETANRLMEVKEEEVSALKEMIAMQNK